MQSSRRKQNIAAGIALVIALLLVRVAAPAPVVRNYGIPDPQRTITHVIVHHTAAQELSVAAIRAAQKRRGFRDIAYHYVVFPDGRIETGRAITKQGVGVWGRGKGWVEIVLVGNFTRGPVPAVQWEAAATLAARWCHQQALPYHRVRGHKEVAHASHPTACPGLDHRQFRRTVQEKLDALLQSDPAKK